ncbi:VOC family protein [Desulfosporosinus fructosivorans]
MKYTCTLIVVKNIEKAKQFYHDVLGLEIVADY